MSNDGRWYDVMQVCRGGHVITEMATKYPEYRKPRCPDCGSETIEKCDSCGTPIQGHHHVPGVYCMGSNDAPGYCHSCGEPYPWTDDKPLETDKHAETAMTNRVFVVHGHDDEMKHAVARVLTQLKLEPIILHEQPNEGKTIIEKFERDADVGFAVILLSPDDIGYPKSSDPKDAQHRARQNVILELGYFVGRLGRSKVVALKRDNLEVPSDLGGVVYTQFDVSGNWRFEIVRELKAAGYEVDANALV